MSVPPGSLIPFPRSCLRGGMGNLKTRLAAIQPLHYSLETTKLLSGARDILVAIHWRYRDSTNLEIPRNMARYHGLIPAASLSRCKRQALQKAV